MNTKNVFADRFKARRIQLGLSQLELSNKLNIQRTTITNYEKGNIMPTSDNLPEIAQVLNVSVDYLLGRTDYINKQEMTSQIRKSLKDGIHDIEILISDLKEQVALDEELTYKENILTDKQRDIIMDQLDLILKIISQ